MRLLITEQHLDNAIEAVSKRPESWLRNCVLAQSVKDNLQVDNVSTASSWFAAGGTSYAFVSEAICKQLTELFDHKAFDSVRQLLPLELEYYKI
jgi:hypothetical protein